jgi:hypothetical protein
VTARHAKSAQKAALEERARSAASAKAWIALEHIPRITKSLMFPDNERK